VKVEKIKLQRRNIIRDAEIELRNDRLYGALEHVYGKLSITLVAGRNGSGKSSLLSFIPHIFHNLERSSLDIKGAFAFRYSLSRPQGPELRCELYRRASDGPVRLAVAGEFDKKIVRDKTGRRAKDDDAIAYADIQEFLPSNVIVSGFSMSGEYPAERLASFKGDRRLSVFDMSKLYGRNHYSFPPFSPGIARLLTLWSDNARAVGMLEAMLGARLTGMVLVRDRLDPYWNEEAEWMEFSSALIEREARGEVWLNDLELRCQDESIITLSMLSSGQKFLLSRILSILGAIREHSIVILEEPEMHLDPGWSRQVITLLVSFFKDYAAHLFIATHSFSLLNSVPAPWILLANAGRFTSLSDGARTLLANESALAYQLYESRPHVVEYEIRHRLGNASVKELQELFNILGESALRYEVYLMLREQNAGLDEEVQDEDGGEGDELA
jgi:ABC-type multidrug transport system ATPase subunit